MANNNYYYLDYDCLASGRQVWMKMFLVDFCLQREIASTHRKHSYENLIMYSIGKFIDLFFINYQTSILLFRNKIGDHSPHVLKTRY